MKTDRYDMWVESHQTQMPDFDISDAVVNRISKKSQKESIADKIRNCFLMNLCQAKASFRMCVLFSGALAGALRMLFVVYYALFT